MKWLLPGFLMLICLSAVAHATIINSKSCSSTDIQAAINSASTGDTVVVPSGSCTWTASVTINKKGIILQGAGLDVTTITDSVAGQTSGLIVTGASATNFVRITGFTFAEGAGIAQSNNGMVNLDGKMFDVAFRFDHNKLVIPDGASRGIVVIDIYGLIDHLTVDESAAGSNSSQSVSIWGSNDGTDGGFTPWMQPLTLGTDKAVYVEDSTFNYPAVSGFNDTGFDSYGGARWVIRHNTIINTEFCGGHGTDSGDRRSAFSGEFYSNTLTNNSGGHREACRFRGGTGVLYANTFAGNSSWDNPVVMVYRACSGLDHGDWGACDGTLWELGSTNLSNQGSRTCSTNGGVKFCSDSREILCTSDANCSSVGAGTCSTYFDGSGNGGYACRDQPGITHGQVSAPIYAWNNGLLSIQATDGGDGPCGVGLSNYLKAGRDFVNGSAMPGYTAYTYPHPLQSGDGPAPPANLTVVQVK